MDPLEKGGVWIWRDKLLNLGTLILGTDLLRVMLFKIAIQIIGYSHNNV